MATIDQTRLIIRRRERGKWEPIVSGTIAFSDEEQSKMDAGELEYSLTCGLWEEDKFSEDDLMVPPGEVARYPGGTEEILYSMGKMATEDLDQEPGREEIYALLTICATKGPGETRSFKTNVIKKRFRD
jgi:hypothetical protein